MLMAVIAVMVLVLARLDLAALAAWFVAVTTKARTVARTVAWSAYRPWIRRIFTVADSPLGFSAAMATVRTV